MIDVSVADDDGVDGIGIEGKDAIASIGFGLAFEEEAAVEEDLAPADFEEMH
jgi:hypothetical protein